MKKLLSNAGTMTKQVASIAASCCLAITLIPASAFAAVSGEAEADDLSGTVPAEEVEAVESLSDADIAFSDTDLGLDEIALAEDAEVALNESEEPTAIKIEGASYVAMRAASDSLDFTLEGFSYDQNAAREIHAYVNDFRASSDAWYWNSDGSKTQCAGLRPLAYDADLEKAAMQRAAEIAISFSHTRPNGSDCFSVSSKVSGENIAMGQTSAYGVYKDWREDNDGYDGQGHRRNMLDSDFNAIGIGHVVYGKYHFWVQEFGDLSNITKPGAAVVGEQEVVVPISASLVDSVSVEPFQNEVYVGVGKRAEMPYGAFQMNGKSTVFNRYYGMMQLPWASDNSNIAAAVGPYAVGKSVGETTFRLGIGGEPHDVRVVVKANDVVGMNRVYNPNSGEHFYTASAYEVCHLAAVGWNYEGTGWVGSRSSNAPVYRLYSGTDHHYTLDANEKAHLVSVGWSDEGIGWYSDDAKGVPLYRQFNPNVQPSAPQNNSGSHNYTTSKGENDKLVSLGWREEGIGWYGCK